MKAGSKALITKAPLESRAHIHRLDAGLTSIRGAHEIISMVSTRRTVTKLILGHNNLGNEGINVLFRFLESPLGRDYPIAEISLNSNGIRNEGLLAVSRYLKGNEELKELFLQANAFTGDPAVTRAFVEALNSSNLEILSLNTNHGLGDLFIEHFLPHLQAPRLRELHISSVGLTPRSVPYITAFIRSPGRCRMTTLKCNGNSLGLRGVKAVIRAIEQTNYSLLSVEFWANQLSGNTSSDSDGAGGDRGSSDEEGEGPVDETSVEAWKVCQARLARICARNDYLRRETQAQALGLLRYSRVLLLRSLLREKPEEGLQPAGDASWHGFAFTTLPTELQLSILSLLAPYLSSAQRSRVFGYASDVSTLPSLLPSLRPRAGPDICLPDPASPGAVPGLGGGVGGVWALNDLHKDAHCSGGRCLGTLNAASCSKDKERQKWLESVGCSIYEPE